MCTSKMFFLQSRKKLAILVFIVGNGLCIHVFTVNTCINFLFNSYAVQDNENSHKKVSLIGATLHPFSA